MKLNETLLSEFADKFFGYGNLKSDIWFIGMEEGGGNTVEDINNRLRNWERNGKRLVENVALYHEALGKGEYFSGKIKNQPTWNKLIRLALSYSGRNNTLQNVKSFQASEFGRKDSNNCLLELLPLPSPSTAHWIYGTASSLSWLKSRKLYKNYIVSRRIEKLKSLIIENHPKLVVFYGSNDVYRTYWEQIVGKPFKCLYFDGNSSYVCADETTQYLVAKHPVSIGITIKYFEELGDYGSKVHS